MHRTPSPLPDFARKTILESPQTGMGTMSASARLQGGVCEASGPQRPWEALVNAGGVRK